MPGVNGGGEMDNPRFGMAGVLLLLLAVLSGSAAAQGFCKGRPPNVIVIMLDDLGYNDLGIQGSKDVVSPNIDKLLSDGCIFTEFYSVAGFCSPARAGFITGQYPYHIGHIKNPARDDKDTFSGMPTDLTILPQTLKQKGYATAMIGKWHLGIFPAAHPLNRGFDYFMGFLGSGFPYFEWKKKFRNVYEYIFENFKIFKRVTYLTDNFTQAASKFIAKHRKKPFFIFLAYNAVHGPYDFKKKDVDPWVSEHRQSHVAMIKAVDRGVKKIRDQVARYGLTSCTVIVFTNDNGGHANGAINRPLKSFKGGLFEGGIRVLTSITWPRKITPQQKSDKLTSLIDLYPTIEDVARISPSQRNPAVQGVNLMPFIKLEGRKNAQRTGVARSVLVSRKPFTATVRKGKWKLFIRITKKGDLRPTEMYDLYKDVSESNNVLKKNKSRSKAMVRAFKQWDARSIPEKFSGNFRKNPLRLRFTESTQSAKVGKAVEFHADGFHIRGRKLSEVSWEIFRPSQIYEADYRDIKLSGSLFSVKPKRRLKTSITFKKAGRWIVRINIRRREWLKWKDIKVNVS